MKNLISYLIAFVLINSSFGQTENKSDSFILIKKIPGKYNYINVDVFDNIYLIDAGKRIIKLNNNGDSIASYNDIKRFGGPSYIDVSNPMKALVFCASYSTMVFLDKLLIYRNHYNLQKQNSFNTNIVATSYDNNIWLFDLQDFKLKKTDDKGNLLLESADIRMLQNEAPSPASIYDNNNKVYLYDEEKGFFIFDYYGGYQNNLPFLHWQHTGVEKDFLYGFSENTMHTYRINSFDLREYQLPSYINNYKSIKVMNGKLYLLKDDGIEIYGIR